MTSIDLYAELIKDVDTGLLASERESKQSIKDAASDEFETLVQQIRELLEEVGSNNRDILRLKDKLIVNAKPEKEAELCEAIRATCDRNYLLITQMRESLLKANQIVEKHRTDSPDQPETFSKVYRKQHLAQQVDKILNESFTIQKLVERFSFETTLKRIRLVLPEISEEEGQKMAKGNQGLLQAMKQKITGKASLQLKYMHEDILGKAQGIAELETSVCQNLKLMKEVSLLVYKQGEMIDSIFANVESAKNYVVKGEAVLKKEKEEHKKSRKKMCCIIFIGLFVIALVITPIIITKLKSSSATPSSDNNTNGTSNSTVVNQTMDSVFHLT